MPKQLKIIVEDGYVQTAPFTVNFATPVIIEPGNKIALDKWTGVINGITSGFQLARTTFILYPSLTSPNLQSSSVTLPSKAYSNVAELLADLTTYCNNAISGYNPDFLPFANVTRYYRDLGLKFGCSQNQNAFQIQYVSAAEEELVLTANNLALNTSSYYAPPTTSEGPFNFSLFQADNTKILVQGGGATLEFQLIVPTPEEAALNDSSWQVGLVGSDLVIHGLRQSSNGILELVGGVAPVIIDTVNFPKQPNAFVQIYQGNGNFILRTFYRNPDTGLETPIFNSNDDSPGALGAMDYTMPYVFEMIGQMGETYNGDLPYPQISELVNMTVDVPFTGGPVPDPVFNRTCAIDMSSSGALRAGLDVPPGLVFLSPSNSSLGSYTAAAAINMSIINSSFDIAIEILNIPLQTYQASSTGYPGDRTNVISYFHPELSTLGSSTYIYDSRVMQWLDIDISYLLNLSSMSFRVFDPSTGIDINAQSMSFNLLISDVEY